MSAPPYMKWFWADYHKDTRHLTRGEHGAYFLLIGETWNRGGYLPDDDALLARLALASSDEWDLLKPVVMAFFKPARGRWRHKRVVEELAAYGDVSRKRKEAGRKGGKTTRGKDKGNTEAIATPIALQKPPKPKPEPEPEREDTQIQGAGDLATQNREAQIAAGDALASMATHPGIASLAPLRNLLAASPPCDWREDVLPAIESAAAWHRSRDGPGSMRTWTTACKIALQNRDRRLAPAPVEPSHERPNRPASAKFDAKQANHARAFAGAEAAARMRAERV